MYSTQVAISSGVVLLPKGGECHAFWKDASVCLPLINVSPGPMPQTLTRPARAIANVLVRPDRPIFPSVYDRKSGLRLINF